MTEFKELILWDDPSLIAHNAATIEQIRKRKQAGETYSEIGRSLNVTRQAIQSKLKPDKDTYKKIIAESKGVCQKCGKSIKGKVEFHHINYESNEGLLLCTSCHRVEHRRHHAILKNCKECGNSLHEYKYKNNFCSPECHKKYYELTLVCSQCGKVFIRSYYKFLSSMQRGNKGIFCGKHCWGSYMAKHYGFIAHPENSGRKGYAAIK
jgi:hypothetical protein